MKQNLLITGYDYDLSNRLAKRLADIFSMRVFDQTELFEFDHMPLSFSEVFKTNGIEYVKKKMKSIVKMELEFDNAVFVADMSFADDCFDFFYKIKLSNFVVFLYKDVRTEMEELTKKKYNSKEECEFRLPSENLLKKRELAISFDCADVSLDISNLSEDEIIEQIVDKIEKYYSVN